MVFVFGPVLSHHVAAGSVLTAPVLLLLLQGGELAVEDLDRFFNNTWTALRKYDPMLGRRLHDQQRPPEHMLALRQQMGSAHQQLQQQLPAAMQRQWQQQQGLSEGQDSNGQQSAFQAAASSNGDSWPGSLLHPLAHQQQQAPEWLPQYRLGSMLLDAATQAGMALEALLKCPTDRQVAVLLNYLALPQGKAAMQSLQRHAAPALVQQQRRSSQEQPVQQQHHQQQRRLSHEQPVQQQQQPPEEASSQAGQHQQHDGQQQQQVTAEPPGPIIQEQGSQPAPTKQQSAQEQEAQDQQLQQEPAAVGSNGVEPSQTAAEAAEQGPAEQDKAAVEQEDGADGQEDAAKVCLFCTVAALTRAFALMLR
jgi:hypothetical protein